MAISFDGTSQIDVTGWTVPSATTGILTVSWWMIPTNVAAATQRPWGSGTELEVRFNTAGVLVNDIFEDTVADDPAASTVMVNNTLYHIVCTGDANTNIARIYVNGVLEDTHLNAIGTVVGTALSIGNRRGAATTDRLRGTIDDWRSYNRILSDAEIETLFYSRGRDSIVHGLTAWFPFNEGAPGAVVTAPREIAGGLASTVVGSPTYAESRLHMGRRAA